MSGLSVCRVAWVDFAAGRRASSCRVPDPIRWLPILDKHQRDRETFPSLGDYVRNQYLCSILVLHCHQKDQPGVGADLVDDAVDEFGAELDAADAETLRPDPMLGC
jgi:hypothetical protein